MVDPQCGYDPDLAPASYWRLAKPTVVIGEMLDDMRLPSIAAAAYG
jgi:hypothetical protein